MANQDDVFKKVIAHAKEYGYVFQSSELYDGLAAVYDYGSNGSELKKNIKDYWWASMVKMNENIVGIDSAIFMHPNIWKASCELIDMKGKTFKLPEKEEISPLVQTDRYLAHLKAYPKDWDTREKLATHYVENYDFPQGFQEGANQLEILIASKLSDKEEKCRWIHLLADWQAKIGRDPEGARETLGRIIEMYPGSAQASQAERAIQYVRG